MIAAFFMKPLGGAKFRRFGNIIMNVDHDEFGRVDVDKLTTIHHIKMQRRFEMESKKEENEPTKNKASKMSKDEGSQECVGDHKSGSKFEWANMGAAYINPREVRINPTEIRIPPDLGRSKSGRALKLTYAQAVAE